MRVFVLGSSSSGNAILVVAGGARILVDAGVGPARAKERLDALGTKLDVDAIVATHEHGDHFGQLERLARATGAAVHLHRGIAAHRVRKRFPVHDYTPGTPFRVADVEITALRVPHDAPQVAVRLATRDHAFTVATDVGHVTNELTALLAHSDAALLEANHCTEMLAFGPYPPRVQARVGGGLGHLSNDRAADAVERAAGARGSRLGRVYLGHLSRANNTPERALETVAARARGIDVEVLPAESPCAFGVVRKHPIQLGLPFG